MNPDSKDKIWHPAGFHPEQAGAAKDQAAGAVKSATGNKAGGNAQGVSGAIKDAVASGKQVLFPTNYVDDVAASLMAF